MRPCYLLATSLALCPIALPALAQAPQAEALAELLAVGGKVGSTETRIRVDATHRVWSIALAAPDARTKVTAIKMLCEPIGSSSDHIRMPAVYAVAEIAGTTSDVQVKLEALAALAEPVKASQVPIRDVAIDAVNQIVSGTSDPGLVFAGVRTLIPAIASGNNGVRIPAIHALVRSIRQGGDDRACEAALDALVEPLNSSSIIGGMEIRMMAVAAAEKIGNQCAGVSPKAKAMGLLQSYAAKDSWEPEAKRRARDAAAAIQSRLK